MTRTDRKFSLIRNFGLLVSPVKALFDSPTPPSPVALAMEHSKYVDNLDSSYDYSIKDFLTINGLVLNTYYLTTRHALYEIAQVLHDASGLDFVVAKHRFDNAFGKASNAIYKLPSDDPGLMIPAQSPFSAYLRILSICGTVTQRLQFFDPYLDSEVFDRYLVDIPPQVQITILTSERDTMRKHRNRSRVVAVSELYASQYPSTYSLMESLRIHDRHLRADDKIFHLGSSSKDAAKKAPYTLSKLDGTAANHAFFDQMIAESTPWYQPGMANHRKWCAQCDAPTDPNPKQTSTCQACNTVY